MKTIGAAISPTRDPDLLQVGTALKRAAIKAQELARKTGTPFYVWLDGKVVDMTATAPAEFDAATGQVVGE